MARPRKSPHLKNQPITISLPPNMIAEIDETLSYKANRSKWIQGAIELKLFGDVLTPKKAINFLLDTIENNPNNINPAQMKELYDSILLDFTFSED